MVSAKSLLTYSSMELAGGFFGAELKAADFDAIDEIINATWELDPFGDISKHMSLFII